LLFIMKLSKLYSNDSRFHNIKFNLNGLSVVYADVTTAIEEKKNSHDLGKTKLAELIDVLLIKQLDSSSFLLKTRDQDGNNVFKHHIFYLELLLNSGKFLTIRREIANPSKVSFAIQEQTTADFMPPKDWEYEGMPLKQARKQLGTYLNLDFFHHKNYDYRKAIS